MKRIFIGVKIPPVIADLALAWERGKETWPVRWLKAKNLHLTLVPPFEANNPEALIAKLAEIKPAAAGLVFQSVSYGPRPPDFRLIWAVGQPAPALEKLKIDLAEKLGLRLERRKFLPHLTLARFRPEDFRRFAVKNLAEPIDWRAEVKNFALFESILTPGGAEYEIIKEF